MFGFAKKLVSQIETQATNYLNVSSTNSDDNSSSLDDNVSGLRVINVEKNSLGSKYGFEAWFDFIIGVNGHQVTSFLVQENLDSNPYSDNSNNISYTNFLNYLNHEINQSKNDLKFLVWSAKGSITREVTIPNHEFLENNKDQLDEITIPTKSSLNNTNTNNKVENSFFRRLSLTLHLTNINAAYSVWHILKVHPNSPGYMAGLIPVSDYIIGAENGVLITGGEDLLARVINSVHQRWKQKQQQQSSRNDQFNDNINNNDFTKNPYLPSPINDSEDSNSKLPSIILYVYNHDFDVVRPVTIHPNDRWGGQGLLGCDVGYGLLHRLPEVIGKFKPALFSDSQQQQQQQQQQKGLHGDEVFSENGEIEENNNEEEEKLDLTPGSVMFDYSAAIDSDNLLKPTLNAPSFTPGALEQPAIGGHQRRKKQTNHHHVATDADLSSYFEEAAAASKRIDGDRKHVDGESVPPPPKFSK